VGGGAGEGEKMGDICGGGGGGAIIESGNDGAVSFRKQTLDQCVSDPHPTLEANIPILPRKSAQCGPSQIIPSVQGNDR